MYNGNNVKLYKDNHAYIFAQESFCLQGILITKSHCSHFVYMSV